MPYLWIYCRGWRARDAAVWAAARAVWPAAAQYPIYESLAEVGEHQTQLFELPPELSVPQLLNTLSINLLQRSESTRRSCLSCRLSCQSPSYPIAYLWIYCRGGRARDAAVWAAPPSCQSRSCFIPYLRIFCRGRRARDAAVWAAPRAVGPAKDALRERPGVVCAGGRGALPLRVGQRDQRHQVRAHKEYLRFS